MLYDPKWEVQTKQDVFSLENLIAWLETKPADTVYCYVDNGFCLLGQYFTAMGFEQPIVYSNCVVYHGPKDNQTRSPYPSIFNTIALLGRSTFGAALNRARKALRK